MPFTFFLLRKMLKKKINKDFKIFFFIEKTKFFKDAKHYWYIKYIYIL